MTLQRGCHRPRIWPYWTRRSGEAQPTSGVVRAMMAVPLQKSSGPTDLCFGEAHEPQLKAMKGVSKRYRLRRSNFDRRIWQPACDGDRHAAGRRSSPAPSSTACGTSNPPNGSGESDRGTRPLATALARSRQR
jgi:hypothetical protein